MIRVTVFSNNQAGGALEQELRSTKNVGGITNGQTFPAGTPLSVILQTMLTVEEPPTYQVPTVSLGSNYANNQLVEAGTDLTVNLTATVIQRDGGPITEVRFYQDGALVGTDVSSPYSQAGLQSVLTDSNIVFYAEADYDQGPVKNSNLGNPDANGQIAAGTRSSANRTIRSMRRGFYGVDTAGSNSAEIRALAGTLNNPANNTEFTINIPAGAASVVFAYPASLPAVESVKFVEGLNAEVKGVFTETSISVEGANNYDAIPYRVYRYEPSNPFGNAATYNVRI